MLIGYARVSTDDQNLDLQRDALRLAGCEKVYEDRMSGAKAARPGLAMALEVARAGDVLTVWRLDRLGRSLHDLILLGRRLDEMGVGLMSLREKIDTSSSGGRPKVLEPAKRQLAVQRPSDETLVTLRAKLEDLPARSERWPGESGQRDKWIFCLRAARIAADQEST
jgi:hypothetical protein